MKQNNPEEFTCYDSKTHTGMIFTSVSMLLFYVIFLICAKTSSAKEWLALSILFGILVALIEVILVPAIFNSTDGKFTINKEYCEISTKTHGERIYLQIKTSEVRCIAIVRLPKTKLIVLVDAYNKMGTSGLTERGTYIKLKYAKNKLDNIKRFLPDCEIINKYGFGEIL